MLSPGDKGVTGGLVSMTFLTKFCCTDGRFELLHAETNNEKITMPANNDLEFKPGFILECDITAINHL